ncbi:MAG TPA: DUF6603 domain-containing protein [Pyrinomonadaceae bacterium]
MAEGEPLSTKDLFLLAVGLYKLQTPGPTAATGEDYYLDKNKQNELRETVWNLEWFQSPQKAWEEVRHRDWLFAHIASNLVGGTHDFTAIPEPVFVSLDLLGSEFRPGMPNASEAIKQTVTSENGYDRGIFTTLTVGLSEQDGVVVLGAGMRRRTRVWKEESQALQADVEFFVPFLPLSNNQPQVDSTRANARSINAGLRIARANGSSIGREIIGQDDDGKSVYGKDLAAVRFNLRVPFNARVVTEFDEARQRIVYRDMPGEPSESPFPNNYKWEPGDLVTDFGDAQVEVQKQYMTATAAEPAQWETFDGWARFVEEFWETTDGAELLEAPIGPLLLDTVSDDSGIMDLFRTGTEIKKDFEESKKEIKEAAQLLKGIWENKIPEAGEEPDATDAESSMRTLGGLLESLGLIETGSEYSLADVSELTVWDVLGRLLDELDGFPLYTHGIDAKDRNSKRIAVSLASQSALNAPGKHYFGIAGLAYNIPVYTTPEKKEEQPEDDAEENPVLVLGRNYFEDDENEFVADEDEWVVVGDEKKGEEKKEEKPSGVEVRLHLGKWFSDETLDDNWFRRLLPPAGTEKSPWKRRVPLPGIRLFPFQRTLTDGKQSEAVYTLALRGDFLSLGFDLKGKTKDGLTFLKFGKGPLSYFGLGAFELRIAFLTTTQGRVVFGGGIKLKDMRLSLAPKEKEKEEEEKASDEIVAGLQGLLGDDEWVAVPAPKKEESKPKTRLSAKRKDKFSISAGYLMSLTGEGDGTLDVQLYDEKGVRGKTIWIPIERRLLAVYIKDIGIGLKGLENFELSEGLPDDAKLTVALNGGLRWPAFELGFIGATLSFPLNDFGKFKFSLDGLDISFKAGPVVISGSFMKNGLEYGGSLSIELPKLSIAAIGFYGHIAIFDMKEDEEVLKHLRTGRIHPKLSKEMSDRELKPVVHRPVRNTFPRGAWTIDATDGKRYTVIRDGGKLHFLSPDKAVFVYGAVSAGKGGGIQMGPIELTAVAVGFGINRRLLVPTIENVAEFPLVKMVMGEGGYQDEDESGTFIGQVSKAVAPSSLLKDMGDAVVAESGQYFICAGARFTVARVLDCFALVVVQFGNEFELSILGLARLKQPSDPSAKPICYIEMQLLMSVKPSEGSFKLQGLLTSNSWVFNTDCKLRGGFAVFVWYGGPHQGDFVITLGGYHPSFKRPDHYPIVPRFELNWQISPQLSVKGSGYFAITPSCGMAGGKLEAVFRSGRVTVWFTAYWDVIVNWSPFHFEADIGVSLRVEARLFLFTLKVTISAKLQMWGPPVGGYARFEVSVITVEIPFGARREPPKLIEKWQLFAQSFLSPSEADKKATQDKSSVPAITTPTLVAGRNNFAGLPNEPAQQQQPKTEDGAWKVRPDQLELAAAAAVPLTKLNVGSVKTNSPPVGVQERAPSGNTLLVQQPVVLEAKGLHEKSYDKPLGVHPMGKDLTSVLNVTVVRDDVGGTSSVDLSRWFVEMETASLPASLWDPSRPKPNGPSEPSADLVPDCITGLKSLKPPPGRRGAQATLTSITWHALEPFPVPRPSTKQEAPTATRSRDVQTASAAKQTRHEGVADALAAAGFNLAWRPSQTQVRFRELQAEPLAGAVAPSNK